MIASTPPIGGDPTLSTDPWLSQGQSDAAGLGDWLEDGWKRRDLLLPWPRRVHQDRVVAFKRNSYYKLHNKDPSTSRELQHLYAHWSLDAAEAFVRARPGVLLADLIWSRDLTQRLKPPKARLYPRPLRYVPLPDGLSGTSQRQLKYRQFPSLDPQTLDTTALRFYRCVIDGWTWQEIADAEGVQAPNGVTAAPAVRSVIRTIQHFAKDLGVTLLAAPRGRPRGRRNKR